jgi:hypothetical protein
VKEVAFVALFLLFLISCALHDDNIRKVGTAHARALDNMNFPYKPSYSSDISVSDRSDYVLLTLRAWKLFEEKQFDSLFSFFADSVSYQDPDGISFHGPKEKLIEDIKKDAETLDSIRFDLISWLPSHINDKDEDWVSIWAVERIYPKIGKADTTWIQENWQIKKGKLAFFNQFRARPAKG